MLSLNILQDMFDMSDGETAEAFDFNTQWHIALETPPDQAQVCVKSIYNFRKFLETVKLAKKVFERATGRFIEKFNIRATHHRLDSTHFFSNMAKLNRLGLFTKTIEQFLKKLQKKQSDAFEALPAFLRVSRRKLPSCGEPYPEGGPKSAKSASYGVRTAENGEIEAFFRK